MKKALLCFSLLFVLFSGCSNDIDINAPQEEVMVVYALLNKFDSIQYIKVNKGFASDDKSPIELAKDPDQLFFDSLNVILTDKTNSLSVDCYKVTIEKNAGIFSNAVNYVYATNLKLIAGHRYEIRVENPISGNVVSSELTLIGDPDPKSPNSSNIDIYPIEPDKLFSINFDADKEATMYEIRLNFVYEEINSITSEVILDTIPWVFATGKFNDQKRILIRLDGRLFYEQLASKLEQKGSEITRRGKHLEYEYWCGDKELSTYIDVYGTSSIGVVQKKTDYTNIKGGYGLFAGRNLLKITGTKIEVRIQNQLTTNTLLTPFRFVD